MSIKTLAIDLAKESFYVCGKNDRNEVIMSQKISALKLRKLLVDLTGCRVFMESCGGSNYWGNLAEDNGHEAFLISPQHVKPYVTSNQKNDRNDCLAILEAANRPHQYFQKPKSAFCQNVQMTLKARQYFLRQKVALTNHIRGLLLEKGIAVIKGDTGLKKKVLEILSDANWSQQRVVMLVLQSLYSELLVLENKVKELSEVVENLVKEQPVIKKLTQVPGVGPLSAAWFFAHFGDGKGYQNGRQAAACLGLVPRQNSTGGKSRLLGITKQGDTSVRTVLIHGARSFVRAVNLKGPKDPHSAWVHKLLVTKSTNKTAVAVANKNARIMWSMLRKGTDYNNKGLQMV